MTRIAGYRIASIAWAFAMLTACGQEMSVPERTVTPLGIEGGTALSAEGGLEVELAPGALAENTDIIIDVLRDESVEGLTSLGYAVGPESLALIGPAILHIAIDDPGSVGATVIIAIVEGGTTIPLLGSAYDPASGVVSAPVLAFGTFVALSMVCDPTIDPICWPGCAPGDPNCTGCDPALDPNCIPGCDPSDPACACDPATDPMCGCVPGDPGCSACDPADPTCACLPGDPNCAPCDPNDPACGGWCDPATDPTCACVPGDPNCAPCDPNDPACGGWCDPATDPTCACVPGDPNCGWTCDPATDPSCIPGCDPSDPACGGWCDPAIDPFCVPGCDPADPTCAP